MTQGLLGRFAVLGALLAGCTVVHEVKPSSDGSTRSRDEAPSEGRAGGKGDDEGAREEEEGAPEPAMPEQNENPGEQENPAPDAPRCDPAKPFGARSTVAVGPNVRDLSGVVLTADELTAYYTVHGSAQSDVYVTTRPTRTAPFGTGTRLNVNRESNVFVGAPSIANGNELYFGRLAPEGDAREDDRNVEGMVRSMRSGNGASFGLGTMAPLPRMPIDVPEDEWRVASDGRSAYVAGYERDPSARTVIFEAVNNGGSWQRKIGLDLGDDLRGVREIVVSHDQLTMYFRANSITGDEGVRGIYETRRSSRNAAFSGATQVDALKTDRIQWLSADGCAMYMLVYTSPSASEKEQGLGPSDKLWRMMRGK